jgi:hypothetical protein
MNRPHHLVCVEEIINGTVSPELHNGSSSSYIQLPEPCQIIECMTRDKAMKGKIRPGMRFRFRVKNEGEKNKKTILLRVTNHNLTHLGPGAFVLINKGSACEFDMMVTEITDNCSVAVVCETKSASGRLQLLMTQMELLETKMRAFEARSKANKALIDQNEMRTQVIKKTVDDQAEFLKARKSSVTVFAQDIAALKPVNTKPASESLRECQKQFYRSMKDQRNHPDLIRKNKAAWMSNRLASINTVANSTRVPTKLLARYSRQSVYKSVKPKDEAGLWVDHEAGFTNGTKRDTRLKHNDASVIIIGGGDRKFLVTSSYTAVGGALRVEYFQDGKLVPSSGSGACIIRTGDYPVELRVLLLNDHEKETAKLYSGKRAHFGGTVIEEL